jgi:sarcosine oxidase gamma subunit
VFVRDPGDDLLHSLLLAHVHGDAARPAAGGTDLDRGGINALLLSAGEYYVRTERGQGVGDAAADAAAAAGDERHPAVEQAGPEYVED